MSVNQDPFTELRQIAGKPKDSRKDSRSLAELWPVLSARDGERCFYCWKPLSIDTPPDTDDSPTIEHVPAKTRGGGWWKENLVLACGFCNCLVAHHSIAWKIAYRDEAIARRLAEKMRGAA